MWNRPRLAYATAVGFLLFWVTIGLLYQGAKEEGKPLLVALFPPTEIQGANIGLCILGVAVAVNVFILWKWFRP